MPKQRQSNSISKNHFSQWRFLSEGATEDIYLVTSENSLIKIPAGNHGQKKRRMSDGLLIDRHNTWFGPRKLVHQKEKHNEETLSNLEKVKKLFSIFKSSEEEEFKSLGDWWNKQPDKHQCELLEVFANCEDIKTALNGGRSGEKILIKDGLKISPEKLIKLSRRKFKPPKLSDLLGSRSFIHFPKLGEVGWLAGGVVDEWMEDYTSDKYIQKEQEGGVNLFSLLEKTIKGEHSFKECSGEEKTQFYNECKNVVHSWVRKNEKLRVSEITITPKVVGVVKGGTIEGEKEIRVSVGSNENKANLVKRWVQEGKQESETGKRIYRSLQK
ncbi:hypothetical protein [Mycoplasma suis]|uniref:Uncharacterized protein n=1 Tax=Mycoplasma suis (strain Illinois) TaxID=768700 RepID=F0QRG6_MYCSL|nr:hypothetical protein [Mycoplasma suis]ADX98086.1 hypothetical protein MSU_0553 [Mycoplasma suis str. Illinois]